MQSNKKLNPLVPLDVKNLSTFNFGVTPEDQQKIDNQKKQKIFEEKTKQFEDDFEKAKENIKSILDTTSKSITSLTELAVSSDNPRAYEALSQLVQVMSQTNKDLMELYQTKTDIDQKKNGGIPAVSGFPTTQNNYIFAGTTAEMSELIKKHKKNLEKKESVLIEQTPTSAPK